MGGVTTRTSTMLAPRSCFLGAGFQRSPSFTPNQMRPLKAKIAAAALVAAAFHDAGFRRGHVMPQIAYEVGRQPTGRLPWLFRGD